MRPSLIQMALGGAGLLALFAVILALSQPSFDPGRYEFDIRQNFEGVYRSKPVPGLWVPRMQDPGEFSNYSVYPLVGTGFHGLSSAAERFDGMGVTVSGKLLYNGTLTVIEADDGSIQPITRSVEFPEPSPARELGEVTLRGEIVDIKTYAGYLEPGSGGSVIAPASNAIRGGIPPVLALRTKEGVERAALLLDSNGESIGETALGRIGTPMEVRGKLRETGGLLTLEVRPGTIRRVLPWE